MRRQQPKKKMMESGHLLTAHMVESVKAGKRVRDYPNATAINGSDKQGQYIMPMWSKGKHTWVNQDKKGACTRP